MSALRGGSCGSGASLFRCPELSQLRASAFPPKVLAAFSVLGEGHPIRRAAAEGFLPLPVALLGAPHRSEHTVWVVRPQGPVSGLCFTDGSQFQRAWPARRAGWGFVVLSYCGDISAAAYGSAPAHMAPKQVARDGEDLAVLASARLLDPPRPVFHVDCAGTVGAAAAGSQAAHPRDARAHIWARVRALPGSIRVVKTKAHASEADIKAGVTTSRHQIGNHIADSLAKRGARLHLPPSDQITLFRAASRLARDFYVGVGRFLAGLPLDTSTDGMPERVRSPRRPPGHAGPLQPVRRVLRRRTLGIPAGVQPDLDEVALELLGPTPNGHSLSAGDVLDAAGRQHLGRVLICTTCGGYLWASARSLRRPCPGFAPTAARRRQLDRFAAGLFPSNPALVVEGLRQALWPDIAASAARLRPASGAGVAPAAVGDLRLPHPAAWGPAAQAPEARFPDATLLGYIAQPARRVAS